MAQTKKAVKKAAKKVVKKAPEVAVDTSTSTEKTATRKAKPMKEHIESNKKMPLSKFVCGLLMDGIPDEEIVKAMEQDYPDKDCTMKTVNWYRFAINQGRMEKAGFPKPEGGLINPRRVQSEEKKAEKALKKTKRAKVEETGSDEGETETPVVSTTKPLQTKVSRGVKKVASRKA
jgi:hypothetical protein